MLDLSQQSGLKLVVRHCRGRSLPIAFGFSKLILPVLGFIRVTWPLEVGSLPRLEEELAAPTGKGGGLTEAAVA